MARPKSAPTPVQIATNALSALETIDKSVAAIRAAASDLPSEPLAFLSPEINDRLADARAVVDLVQPGV